MRDYKKRRKEKKEASCRNQVHEARGSHRTGRSLTTDRKSLESRKRHNSGSDSSGDQARGARVQEEA